MSTETPRTPFDMGAGRMEAFSDAVMAVIITLLAFELKPPDGTNLSAVSDTVPSFLIYVLSFLLVAIYWNNHHHLLRASDRISGTVMWANMLLLFCLSLIPVSTEWLGNAYNDTLSQGWDLWKPVAFFGVVSLAAALAYTWLVRALIRANGPDSPFTRAIHKDVKGKLSLALYTLGIVTAVTVKNAYLAYACYAAVSVMWLIPDRRFTHAHEGDEHPH